MRKYHVSMSPLHCNCNTKERNQCIQSALCFFGFFFCVYSIFMVISPNTDREIELNIQEILKEEKCLEQEAEKLGLCTI